MERDLGLARGLGVGPGLQARLDAAPQRREALGAEPRRHLAREGGVDGGAQRVDLAPTQRVEVEIAAQISKAAARL